MRARLPPGAPDGQPLRYLMDGTGSISPEGTVGLSGSDIKESVYPWKR